MALEDYIQQDAPEPVEIDYNSELAQKGYYGFFRDFYKKPDLEAEERMMRRQRSLALLGDLAKLGTQTFAASQGARQFNPHPGNPHPPQLAPGSEIGRAHV